MTESNTWPVVLSIAGSDSGGGAGIQADLRVLNWFQVFGTTAITAVTAQNPSGVRKVDALTADMVGSQIDAVFEGFPVQAVKTGMLFHPGIIEVAAEKLRRQNLPVVVDPVMAATSGAVLLQPEAMAALTSRLLPLATVITPNLSEAEILAGRSLASEREREWIKAAGEMGSRFGAAILLKGGHGTGEVAADYLYWNGDYWRFSGPRVDVLTTHGTGCMFSSGIAAGLALGLDLPEAVMQAKAFVYGTLTSAVDFGNGTAALVAPSQLPLSELKMEQIDG